MERLEKSPNYMTVPVAIHELEKIEMVRQTDGIYRMDHAVTATQKAILKAFNIDADYVRKKAAELSRELAEYERKGSREEVGDGKIEILELKGQERVEL